MRLACLVAAVVAAASARASSSPCQKYSQEKRVSGRLIVVLKEEKRLCYFDRKRLILEANVSYGRSEGKKRFQGDNKTPEGRYMLSPARKSKKYGLFMHVSYPSQADKRYAKKRGRSPGSAIGVHGPQKWYTWLGTLQAAFNHSMGCIVLDVDAMRRLAKLITKPIPIEIVPKRK